MHRTIVISAVNLFEGGPLSILYDCLKELNAIDDLKVIALVHRKALFEKPGFRNIYFEEYPRARKSYLFRLYYEYYYFHKLAKIIKPDLWFSLHDLTPNVGSTKQAVYCHNPSPFNTYNLKDIYIQPTQLLFRLIYKYFYRINLNKNKYIIVQQLWLKRKFESNFEIKSDKIVISRPLVPEVPRKFLVPELNSRKVRFFYPTYPRPFKNIEVLCKAVIELRKMGHLDFDLTITIDGSENNYSKSIVRKYGYLPNINFIGLVSRERVYSLFNASECLVFPSKLETWGLPITECIQFNKPMIVSDLEYAKETVGGYEKAVFFNPDDFLGLSRIMESLIINRELVFSKTHELDYPQPCVNSWSELLKLICGD